MLFFLSSGSSRKSLLNLTCANSTDLIKLVHSTLHLCCAMLYNAVSVYPPVSLSGLWICSKFFHHLVGKPFYVLLPNVMAIFWWRSPWRGHRIGVG